jgi:hypothetical protein
MLLFVTTQQKRILLKVEIFSIWYSVGTANTEYSYVIDVTHFQTSVFKSLIVYIKTRNLIMGDYTEAKQTFSIQISFSQTAMMPVLK